MYMNILYVYVYLYVRVFACVCAFSYTTCVCMCVCMCVRVCVRVCASNSNCCVRITFWKGVVEYGRLRVVEIGLFCKSDYL